MLASVRVPPEATIFTYCHAAFSVRQIIFVPLDDPAIVMLLDVSTSLPIRITRGLPAATQLDVAGRL